MSVALFAAALRGLCTKIDDQKHVGILTRSILADADKSRYYQQCQEKIRRYIFKHPHLRCDAERRAMAALDHKLRQFSHREAKMNQMVEYFRANEQSSEAVFNTDSQMVNADIKREFAANPYAAG